MHFLLLSTLFFSSYEIALAEGSKDLYPSGATGIRFWMNQNGVNFRMEPDAGIPQNGVHYVYAEAGEVIHMGHSGMGINKGDIMLVKPDGTLVTSGSFGGGDGKIANRTEELAGPGALTAGGYGAMTYTVGAGEDGVFCVFLIPPRPERNNIPGYYTAPGDTDQGLLANWNWDSTYQCNCNSLLAWDITVENSGVAESGRVFIHKFPIWSRNFFCDRTGSLTFYTLTDEGVVYKVDYIDLNPGQADFTASSKGLRDAFDEPLYKSLYLNGCGSPPDLTAVGCGNIHPPEELDIDDNISYKMFYNQPDGGMPTSADQGYYYTSDNFDPDDIEGDSITDRWLFPGVPWIDSLSYIDTMCDLTNLYFSYYASRSGMDVRLMLDLDSNGIYTDAVDVILMDTSVQEQTSSAGILLMERAHQWSFQY